MIDQREVFASKLWRHLREIQRDYNIVGDSDFNYLLLFLSGCVCVADHRHEFANFLTDRVLHDIYKLTRQYYSGDDESSNKLWQELERDLHQALGIEGAGVRTEFPGDAIGKIIVAIRNAGSSELDSLYLFEVAYRRYINHQNPLDFRIGRKIAELASYLVPESAEILDYFIESGDLAVLTRERTERFREVRAQRLPSNQFPLRLRLALHGIFLKENRNLSAPHHNSFILINHPAQAMSREIALRDQSRTLDNSAVEAFDRLLGSRANFELMLVVVPGADRSAAGIRRTMRQHIVKRHVLAVIDLPISMKASDKKKTISIWVVAKNVDGQPDILFVDATKPMKMESSSNSDEPMRFVASLIRLWLPEQLRLPVEDIIPNSEGFEGLFRHEFRGGYKDVLGLCRAVSREEVSRGKCALIASTYLTEEGRRPQKLPRLDSHPVLDLLALSALAPKRIYVIGNNGEGKSLLLGELIEHMAKIDINTVGISFGLTDRFPFKRESNVDRSLFTYMGARTSEKGMQLELTKRVIVRNMKNIQTDQARLEVFQAVTDLLGFNHSLFMVPDGYDLGNFETEENQLSDIVFLTGNAEENKSLLKRTPETNFTLGLMRKRSRNEITLFEELSSGEQQLLMLAIKLVSKGGARTVILIDEPEISLHVSWQRALPAMFELISERLECSIVIATHSPVIIASAVRPSDHCFAAQQRTLNPISPQKRQSVEAVLFDSFKTYTHHTRRVHERCAAMVSETMTRLNLNDVHASIDSVTDLLSELDIISNIVESVPAGTPEEQLNRDIGLIRKTRAAILELVTQQRSVVGER